MFPALPDAPGGGSASVSRPPHSVLSPNTGSLCKFSPVAEIGSQLGDVCAPRVGEVPTCRRQLLRHLRNNVLGGYPFRIQIEHS